MLSRYPARKYAAKLLVDGEVYYCYKARAASHGWIELTLRRPMRPPSMAIDVPSNWWNMACHDLCRSTLHTSGHSLQVTKSWEI